MARRLPPTPQTPFLVGEVDDIPFRFGKEMTPDESIATVDVDCLSVGEVVDPAPDGSLPTGHQVQGTTVLQRFEGIVPGARYVLAIKATMSSGRVFIGDALIIVLPVLRS